MFYTSLCARADVEAAFFLPRAPLSPARFRYIRTYQYIHCIPQYEGPGWVRVLQVYIPVYLYTMRYKY
jgi:hypothetical protein